VDKAATTGQAAALRVITEQMSEAISASKCHGCGCLHKTVEALSSTEPGKAELAAVLAEAHSVFTPKQYDCLGCPVCFPAIAANSFADGYPELGSSLDLCPTDEPVKREGWPPLPGDYHVVRYLAPIAVCTLNSPSVEQQLSEDAPEGLAIVGALHTENLGISESFATRWRTPISGS
jgi:tetrahydromethanopterin S-methyltransferase subunit A